MPCTDVSSNRKLLIRILQRKGIECDQAVDGCEAIDLVQKNGIDYYHIIFMDSVMPKTCGPEAAQSLRLMGFSKLIIGVTGNALDSDIKMFEDVGVDLVMTKPVRVELLDRVLQFSERGSTLAPSQGSALKKWLVPDPKR